MDKMPLISIVIPLFNRALLIRETLSSVINQSYKNWEVIVVDDHSTDNSREVVEEFCKTDNRIHYYLRDREPKGAPACRNIGVQKSQGNYIIFLDADDLLSYSCLENRVKFLNNNPHLDFAVFPMSHFKHEPGENDKTWRIGPGEEDDLDRFLKHDWWLLIGWLTTSPLWKKEALARLGGFDESLMDWQDWDLHIRALISGFVYEKVSIKPDWCYRLEGGDKISKSKSSSIKEKIIRRGVMLEKNINLLRKHHKLNNKRKELISGIYYNFASILLSGNYKTEAILCFKQIKKLQINTSVAFWSYGLRFSIKLLKHYLR
jgi:glycosyltransferase involved in cell wall biosynthesis